MNFVQPWFLLGLLGAAIPLLVHLFDRRRPREIKFAALAFVMRSQKRSASRLRLKKILIYLLRTLVLLAIPLALAQPSCSGTTLRPLSQGAMATAIVVDVSFATRFGGLHQAALTAARNAVGQLRTEEPATLIVCNNNPQSTIPLGFDRAPLFTLIDDLKPEFTRIDMNHCIDVAIESLASSPLAQRRVVLVSAFTTSSLNLEGASPQITDSKGQTVIPEVVLRDIAQQELPNRAIVDARAELAPHLGPRGWQFVFTVKNFSTQTMPNVALNLLADGEVVSKSFVELGPMQSVQKTMTYKFTKSGTVTVKAQLEHDLLPDDDERTLVLSVAPERLALVINGAPSMQKVKDEAFFVEAALSAKGSPVRSVVRDIDAALREDFSKYDLIMILNAKAPTPEFISSLRTFVQSGKGLFVSMGENTEPDAMNVAYGTLLPRTLRVVKTAVEGKQDLQGRPAHIESLDAKNELLAPFVSSAKEGLLSARFNKYVLFEGQNQIQESSVVMALDDGAPLLVIAQIEKSKVAMFASSCDTDWTDLPIRTAFLPLIQRVAAWLSGTLDERENVVRQVGLNANIPIDAVPVISFRSESGRETKIKSRDATSLQTEVLMEPGRYDALDEKGSIIESLAFGAIIDPMASDLTRHDLTRAAQWFGESTVKTETPNASEKNVPWHTWLFVTVVLALFLEGLLLRKPV